MSSTQKDVLDAVATVITTLSLTDCEAVEVRNAPTDGAQWYPGITVHPVRENELAGTNARDDIGYGIQVTMVVNSDNNLDEDDLFGTWRQTIRKAFIHQKLAAITGSCTCLVEPGPVYVDNEKNYDIGTLVIRAIVRESRS